MIAPPNNSKPASSTKSPRFVVPWNIALIWFLRLTAIFQLTKGIYHWAVLLGLLDGNGFVFTETSTQHQIITIYFSVLDPVAGVGLWLTSSWGAVLWLLAVASQILTIAGFQGAYSHLWPLLILELALMSGYLWLTWKVANNTK